MHRPRRVLFCLDPLDAPCDGMSVSVLRANGFRLAFDSTSVYERRQKASRAAITRSCEDIHALVLPYGGRVAWAAIRWTGEFRSSRNRRYRRAAMLRDKQRILD